MISFKRIAAAVCALAFALAAFAPAHANAATQESGTMGTASWTYSSQGVLTVTGGTFTWEQFATVAQARPEATQVIFANTPAATGSWADSAHPSYKRGPFANLGQLASVTGALDTSGTTSFAGMFANCTGLKSLDLSGWDVSGATSLSNMFAGCTSLESVSLSGWNVASVADLSYLFHGCPALATADVSRWNVAAVTTTQAMFENCASLKTVDLSGWNAPALVSTRDMFDGCKATTLKLPAGLSLGADCGLWAPSGFALDGTWTSSDAAAKGPLAPSELLALSAADRAGVWTAHMMAYKTMNRLYNPWSGEHFYTADTVEKDALVRAGWRSEGIGWYAPVTSATPVYRLYSGTDHHYTTDATERAVLLNAGWKDEGIGWYSDDAQGTPLYRQFNPYVNPGAATNNSGSHNYTKSLEENNTLVKLGWKAEGIGWYGLAED
jgi:surface protein